MSIEPVVKSNIVTEFINKAISGIDPTIAAIALAILSVTAIVVFIPISANVLLGGSIALAIFLAIVTPDDITSEKNITPEQQNSNIDESSVVKTTKLTRGIPNTGNTCWLNATLKFIASTDCFDSMFDERNENEPRELRIALRNVIEALRVNSTDVLEMDLYMALQTEISKSIRLPDVEEIFNGEQRDATEFLIKLVQLLSPNRDTMIEQFIIYKAENPEFKRASSPVEPTWHLTINLDESNAETELNTLITRSSEVLTKADNTQTLVTFKRSHHLGKLPDHLMLSLARFDNDQNKITTPLHLDEAKLIKLVENELDNNNRLVPKKYVWYKVQASIVHHGVDAYGHYTCNIREDETFFTHSDESTPSPMIREYNCEDGYFFHLVKVNEQVINQEV